MEKRNGKWRMRRRRCERLIRKVGDPEDTLVAKKMFARRKGSHLELRELVKVYNGDTITSYQ